MWRIVNITFSLVIGKEAVYIYHAFNNPFSIEWLYFLCFYKDTHGIPFNVKIYCIARKSLD